MLWGPYTIGMMTKGFKKVFLVGAILALVGCEGYRDGLDGKVLSACAAVVDGFESTNERSTVKVGEGCTGTYIAPGVVLTAAHCGNPAYIETNGVIRSNIMWVPHPEYDENGYVNDLALLFLDGEIPGMTPSKIGVPDYGPATVQGYGRTDTNADDFGTLREATTEIDTFYDGGKLGTAPGPDACYGDSGGPLYQNNTLVGVTNMARDSGGECGKGGLYTIPALYTDWIASEVPGFDTTGGC